MRGAHALAAAVLGAGLGVQVFLSFMVAPRAFQLFDRTMAAHLLEGLFPAYYAFGLMTTALTLGLALLLATRGGGPLQWGVVGLLVILLLGTVYAGSVLLPRAHGARLRAQAAPAGDLASLEFSRLHRFSVAVNISLFAVGAVTLALHAAARPR